MDDRKRELGRREVEGEAQGIWGGGNQQCVSVQRHRDEMVMEGSVLVMRVPG